MKATNLIIICICSIILIWFQLKLIWWIIFILWIFWLFFTSRDFRNDFLLVYIALWILWITPINTDISYIHMSQMWFFLFLAIFVPYYISNYIYKDNIISYKWNFKNINKLRVAYILLALIGSYFLIPFYLIDTWAYLNWPNDISTDGIIRLFIWTNSLWIWDELFFINIVLCIFRKHFAFWIANISQAILFCSFLYELWFIGWWFIMTYIFAILQWYIYHKTDSLWYVIIIHLTVDFILFLALIYSYHPELLPIFV